MLRVHYGRVYIFYKTIKLDVELYNMYLQCLYNINIKSQNHIPT